VPLSTREAVTFLNDVTGSLEAGKKVAIHCRQGIGRSGLLAAAALITSGLESRKAVHVVSDARGLAIPETSAQLLWLDHLASRYSAVVS